jgi:hypothetical protein
MQKQTIFIFDIFLYKKTQTPQNSLQTTGRGVPAFMSKDSVSVADRR